MAATLAELHLLHFPVLVKIVCIFRSENNISSSVKTLQLWTGRINNSTVVLSSVQGDFVNSINQGRLSICHLCQLVLES